ncbi:MAG: LCP family protein, partial [Limnospira sp.]
MRYPTSSQRQPKILRVLFWSFIVLLIASTSATLGAVTALLSPAERGFDEDGSMVLNALWRDRFRFELSRPV